MKQLISLVISAWMDGDSSHACLEGVAGVTDSTAKTVELMPDLSYEMCII